PPLHVMFSRGYVREKARLLACFRDTLRAGCECECVAVVDMYVGIGYFAFSYLAAEAVLVLGWDINRWSVEACRRGAAGNGWRAEVVSPGCNGAIDVGSIDISDVNAENKKIVLFHESNSHAVDRIVAMKGRVPPIVHINLGILPTS